MGHTNNQLRFLSDRLTTPLGVLLLLCDELGHLRVVEWLDHEQRIFALLARQYRNQPIQTEQRRDPFGLTSALAAYFEGDVRRIESLPVAPEGTAFQRSVWQSLRSISAGETISYGELARRLQQPAAVRAVGLANGANPISIVLPCHRVIGVNGSLTGYGGGLYRKQWLLEHERKHAGSHHVQLCLPT